MRRGLYGRTSALLLSGRKWRKQPPLAGEGGIKLGLLLDGGDDDDDDDEQTGVDNRSARGRKMQFFSDLQGL